MSTTTQRPSADPAPPPRGTARWRDRTWERLADLVRPVDGPEVLPPEVTEPPDPTAGAGPARRYGRAALSLASGFAGALLIAATAPLWYLGAEGTWRFTLPGVPHPGGSLFSGTSFVVGVVLLALGWLGLIGRAERQPTTPRRRLGLVVAALVLWCLPLAAAPPLLSNDVYSYAAQGELLSRGIDPTAHGPTYLLGGDFMVGADPYWKNDPSPYGPVWLGISELAVEATGHDAATSVWVFRGLALAGAAMAAVGVALIARSYRRSAAVAVAIGIANPLMLLYLIGGSHNDALMLGLLALGLAAARRDRRVLAVVLVALATAVKLPAACALPVIGWTWPGLVHLRQRLVGAALATGAGAALVGLLCLVVGIGPGWVFALSGTNRVQSTFSATTKLGWVAADLVNATGLQVDQGLVVNLFRLAGLALAAAISLVVVLRSPQLGVVRTVGWILLVVIVLGPVVWPWYLAAGLALLAAVGLGRYRPSFLVVTVATSLFVFPTSVDTIVFLLNYQHPLGLGVLALVCLAAVASQRLATWSRARRLERARAGGEARVAGLTP